MKDDNSIKYEFETNNLFLSFLLPSIFLPIYYYADINIVFKILLYIIPICLLYILDRSKMTINNSSISYTKYAGQFAKSYNIPFSDIEKVYVTRMEMSVHNTPTLIITSKSLKKKFKVQIYRGIDESLCEYFIDNKIKVETNNSSLRNHISHYLLGHRLKD